MIAAPLVVYFVYSNFFRDDFSESERKDAEVLKKDMGILEKSFEAESKPKTSFKVPNLPPVVGVKFLGAEEPAKLKR